MCGEDGIWAMQNLVVTDHLPEGVDFVSANLGGEYDESTNTVTWNLGDSVKMIDGVLLCDATTFGQEMFVTVRFPAERFTDAVNNHELQTNTVTAQANAWGDEDHELADDAATSHYLQIGADGEFTLQKGKSYAGSNGQGWQFTRGQHTSKSDAVRGYLNQFSIKGTGNASGTWSLVDVLPCGWTSPESADDTDCATPAFTDISFGANGNMSELQVHWITNASRTGVCTIPSGSNVGDTHVRFCEGLTSEDDIAMGDGEWITKFWLDDNPVKAGSAGKLFLFGTVSDRLPIDNSQAVADGEYQPHFLTTGNPPGGPTTQGTPVRGVTPSSEHPLWVTVENCTYDNTIIWNGGSATRNGSLVDSNHEGRCGYVRVARDVINVYAEKRMYNPDRVGEGGSSASPFFTPGEPVRIDVVTQRDGWTDEPKYDQWFFTPKVTEILPENLVFDPKDPEHPVYLALSGEGSDTAAQVIARLGEPRLTLDEVTIDGAARTKIVIDFPDAPADGGLELTQEITIGFDARVKENSPRSTGQNYLLVQAAQAEHSYLVCASPGKYADPEKLTPTTTWGDLEFDNAVQGPDAHTGCRTGKTYSIVDGPGMAANKQVKGTLDSDFVFSPHIGSTDRAGQAEYRIPLKNTGNVDMRGVVLYDLLPRVGDNGVKPGAGARDSAFDVFMTGPVTGLPADTVVQYSTQDEPCRGELAGQGGGSRASAPAGCSDDWFIGAPADWADVTAIRLDFGDRVWKPGDTFTGLFPAVAGEGGDLTGTAWNNVAFAALRASNGTAMLPSEASKVGLQLTPDLSWKKVDGLDPTKLLTGSEWKLRPVLEEGAAMPAGDWPKVITDCSDAANCGEDRDPAAGQFSLKGIPWGTYELTETKAPDGYVVASEPIRFTLGSGDLNVDEWVHELGNVSNYKAGVGLTWQKVDPKGERLNGAEWQLVPVDENEEPIAGAEPIDVTDCVADSAGDCDGIDQSPEGGVFTLASVAPGKYHLIETKAPAGY
ncbi:MAG: SpaA isopeptide-forming pilin-related protein [Microbacteriaceae bacterium]